MALIDLMREALRFLPPQTHRFLRIAGADGKVTLFSSDFRPLYPIWNTYGQPDLPDEYEAFERAAAHIKAALAAKHEEDDSEGLEAASGPVCALHVEAKAEFAVIEDGNRISLIDGEYVLAITDTLRQIAGNRNAKAFAQLLHCPAVQRGQDVRGRDSACEQWPGTQRQLQAPKGLATASDRTGADNER